MIANSLTSASQDIIIPGGIEGDGEMRLRSDLIAFVQMSIGKLIS